MAAQQHGHQYQEITKHSEMLTARPDDPHVIKNPLAAHILCRPPETHVVLPH
jgi:hypothetical protein